MKRSCRIRIAAMLFLIMNMLLAQFAAATCMRGFDGRPAEHAAGQATADPDGRHASPARDDAVRHTLCRARHADTAPAFAPLRAPKVQAVVAGLAYAAVRHDFLPSNPASARADASLLARSTAPPLRIRHCSFRI